METDRVPFEINALNPETGRKDGIQYTFGESHVAQAVARYGEAAGKLGAIKTRLNHYVDGLKILATLPKKPIRQALFQTWKLSNEPHFVNILQGRGQTYLLNLVASHYRRYLKEEANG